MICCLKLKHLLFVLLYSYFLFMIPLQRISTLFPYTTLFRSRCVYYGKHQSFQATAGFRDYAPNAYSSSNGCCLERRSEERFSRNAETDLVCRLLLEKKKIIIYL